MKININDIKAKIEKNQVLTSEEKKAYILYSICDNHTGKMSGMLSISTSCLENPYCIARHANNSLICSHCYAVAQLEYQKTTRNKLYYNTLFYTRYQIKPEDVPKINAKYFRIESFGDVQNILQCKNYYTIAAGNKKTTFAAWTKNPGLYKKAGTKPKNMIKIFSVPEINMDVTPELVEKIRKADPEIDKIFAVHDKSSIQENKIKITCGGNHCLSCLRCYKRTTAKIVNEKLK